MKQQTRLLGLFALCALVIGAAPASGSPPEGRRASDWTIEERLEMRFDQKHVTMRKKQAFDATGQKWKEDVNVVDGSRNPELLLPYELFQGLLARAYGPDKDFSEHFRLELEPLLQSLGFEANFWARLELIAEDLLAVDRERRARMHGFSSLPESERLRIASEIDVLQSTYCQDRARILDDATEAFGKSRFYRLLYQGVALHVSIAAEGVSGDQMRFIAGGCQ